MLTRALRCIYELPDLVQRSGRRHLDGCMLAMLHGIDGDRCMVNPVGSDIDQIYVIALTKLLIHLSITTVGSRLRKSGLTQNLLAALYVLRQHITQRHDLGARDVGETLYGTRSTHAQSDESHTHGIYGWGAESQHVFLPSRTLRNFHLDRCIYIFLFTILVGASHECEAQRSSKKYVSPHSQLDLNNVSNHKITIIIHLATIFCR